MREGGERRILIVDASRADLLTDATALARGEQAVRAVTTSYEAFNIIKAWQPSLVLVAHDLGGMKAPAFCRRVRSEPASENLRILFVAGDGQQREIEETLAAGANDYVTRPLRSADIDRKLKSLLAIPTRESIRTMVKLSVEGRETDRFFLGTTLNLSIGGLLLKTDRQLKLGDVVELQFYLPLDPVPSAARAVVVRHIDAGDWQHYGMHFENLTTADVERIRTYIDRQTKP